MKWESIDEAAEYIERNCRRWGRMGIWAKEKYGTLRVITTCSFCMEVDFLHSIIYPGKHHIKWPNWIREYIDWPIGSFLERIGVLNWIRAYQKWVLKYFWRRAAKKWPEAREEILRDYEE